MSRMPIPPGPIPQDEPLLTPYGLTHPGGSETYPLRTHIFDDGREAKCPGPSSCAYCRTTEETHRLQSRLIGRILTIVDGCVVDERQNKAMKDMLKMHVYEVVEDARKNIMLFIEDQEGLKPNDA